MIENIGAYSQVDYDRGYQQGAADMEKAKQIIIDNLLKHIEQIRVDAIDEVYKVVTQFLIDRDSDLDFNLDLQNKILDLKVEDGA